MKKDISFYIFVMLENISHIRDFVRDLNRAGFEEARITQDAVMLCVTKVAHMTKSVPEDVRSRYPDVPWVLLEGMKEKLEDEHFNVNLEMLWRLVTEEILPLEDRLNEILNELEEEEGYSG
jgi:uncharacterized protein with HEPN domain